MGPSVHASGVHAEWDAATRTLFCRYTAGASPGADAVTDLAEWTMRVAGAGPFGILVDGENSSITSSAFRGAAARQLLAERDRVRVAAYGLDPTMKSVMHVIATITRAPLRSFETRAEAEAWLRAWLSPATAANAPL